jgi:hypothetical protein
VDPTETRRLRALGQRLALYVRSGNKPVSRAALQAVTADLTAEYPELSQPLGDLVGRPGFRALLPLASQGRGTVEREALIQDAARIYLPGVTEALREVLGGFLELPETAAKQVVEPRTTNSELPTAEGQAVVVTPRKPAEPVRKRNQPEPQQITPKRHRRAPLSPEQAMGVSLAAGASALARWLQPHLPPGASEAFVVSLGVLAVLLVCFLWWRKTR